MKKIKKFIKSNIKVVIAFILGISIAGSIGVYAATVIASSNVEYSNTTSGLSATTVQGAIDEIYEKSKTHCPDVYICNKPLCKRATTLHTETCSQTSTSSFCSGDGYTASGTMGTTTITYGSLGTSGTLSTGDAFDCDVNGDGTYDATTERFYYVSDMSNGVTTDSNTAVLIYYNNVSGGVASNSTAYAYDSSGSNNNGPVTALAQLPTTSQWKNVSLTNTTRAITNESGGNTTKAGDLPTAFSYSGYAARLLTYQEVYNGCYDGTTSITSTKGLSTKCKYLLENTKYSSSSLKTNGPWLETPRASSSSYAWIVYGYNRDVYNSTVNHTSRYGVRPAIEVLKSNISY